MKYASAIGQDLPEPRDGSPTGAASACISSGGVGTSCSRDPRYLRPTALSCEERFGGGGVLTPLRSQHPVKSAVRQSGAGTATMPTPRFVLSLAV